MALPGHISYHLCLVLNKIELNCLDWKMWRIDVCIIRITTGLLFFLNTITLSLKYSRSCSLWDLNTGSSVEFVGTDSLLKLASSGHYVTTGISVTTLVAVPHVIHHVQ